ncbi:hypothetical protein [Prauserella flavalba]|uniref:MftR C-terminal domain-containing protein n=1 Tax=Prauserella flavalba TaxID=1477506 RepID=A0A318LBF4_9PSEU|nr:hypothetical protein [Prauserella flavalba]PXY18777.1 hypothetical protein BA062_34820 [Prauserella flavalba]
MAILVHEVAALPERYLPPARAGQQEYVAELVHLLRRANPEVDEAGGRLRIHGALALVNEFTRTRRYAGRPHLVDELSAIALDLCGTAR